MRKSAILIWLFLAASCLFSHQAFASWTAALGEKGALPNTVVEIPLTVNFSGVAGGVRSITFYIRYDDALTFQGTANIYSGVPGIEVLPVPGYPNHLSVTWSAPGEAESISLNGKLMDLVFNFSGGFARIVFLNEFPFFSSVGDSGNNYPSGTTESGSVSELPTFRVSLSASPSNIGAVLTGAGLYPEGYPVDINASEPPGYRFTHWSDNFGTGLPDSPNSRSTGFSMPARNVSLTAHYEEIPPEEVTLTLTIVGGGNVRINGTIYTQSATISFLKGTVINLSAIPDLNWNFFNWTGSVYTGLRDISLTMDTSKALTATFINTPPFILTLNIQGQGAVTVRDEGTFTEPVNNIPFLPPVPPAQPRQIFLTQRPAEGWFFDRWEDVLLTPSGYSERPDYSFTMNRSRTVTAVFTDEVRLRVRTVGYGRIMLDGELFLDGPSLSREITLSYNDIVDLLAIPYEGHAFASWSDHASGTNTSVSIVMNEKEKSVTATFVELFPLTLFVNPDNIGVVLSGAGSYPQEAAVDIHAPGLEHYVFSGWTGAAEDIALLDDASSLTAHFTMPGRAVSFTANYLPGEPDYYSLHLRASPGDIGAVLDQIPEGPYQNGERVDISASLVDGYTFTGWVNQDNGELSFVDDPSAANTFLYMPAANVTLTATYTETPLQTYTLVLLSHPDNIHPVLTGGGEYQEGEAVNISASLIDSYDFFAWTGNPDDVALLEDAFNPSTSLIMPARSMTLTATYEEVPPTQYSLTIHIVGSGSVTVDGTPYESPLGFTEGTTLALQALAAAGWQFSGWSGDLDDTGSEASLTMDSDKEITATFTEESGPDEYTLSIEIVGRGQVMVNGQAYTEPISFVSDPDGHFYLQAFAGQDCQFQGWSGDQAGVDDWLFVPKNGDKLITATFICDDDPDVFALHIDIAGDGEVYVDGEIYAGSILFESDPQGRFYLQAVAAQDCLFQGWSGDATSAENELFVPKNGNKYITATFICEEPPVYYTLNLSVTGNGQVMVDGIPYSAGNHSIGPVPENSVLALEHLAAGGWEFDTWQGDLSGSDSPASLLMDGNKTVTAVFSELPPPVYSITFVVVNSSGIPIPDAIITFNGQTYAAGTYLFEDLPPGLYAYLVQRDGFLPVSGSVTLIDHDLIVEIEMLIDPARIGFLKLFPNPTRHLISVESNEPFSELHVFNAIGQLMMSSSFPYTLLQVSDVSFLASGVYFLRVTTEKDVRTGKFEVIH